ncbi:MAG: hypothetical protein ACTTHG_02785 [Treponemataceae bacterium]
MKKSFFLIIVFLITFIFITLIGTLGYVLYNDCLNFSAGGTMDIFDFKLLLKGITFSSPFSSILSTLFIIFYFIRHSSEKWTNFGIYLFLTGLTWAVIFPLSVKFSDVIEFNNENEQNKNFISKNYFRQTEKGTVYFTSLNEYSLTGSGILITKNSVSTFTDVSLYDFFEIDKDTHNIQDPLFDSILKPGGFMNHFCDTLNLITEIARYSYKGKGLYLAALISMALAIHSVIGFSHYSKWRLCNLCLVFAFFFIYCFVNLKIYSSQTANKIVAYFIHKKVDFLANRQILQIIANTIFFLFSLTIGIIKIIKNPHANEKDDNGDRPVAVKKRKS